MTTSAARSAQHPTDLVPGHAGSAAWIHGASEALQVLSGRGPADRMHAAEYATDLLIRCVEDVEPAQWRRAGLPVRADVSAEVQGGVRASDPAVLHLARTAMSLSSSNLRAVQRPSRWARLADFFDQIVGAQSAPSAHVLLRRLHAMVLCVRLQVGDAACDVIDGLLSVYELHSAMYGRNSYLTSLARTDVAAAYRQRARGADLSNAVRLCQEEVGARTRRYGPDHPFTMVACNLLARCLLSQAEGAVDQNERRRLAQEAYAEADRTRSIRDQLYGITSSNSVLCRRYQAHALLLLGEPADLKAARACLQYALAFETAHNDNAEWPASGQTHWLLARVCLALDDRDAALEHATTAHRLLAAHNPAEPTYREAAALLQKLSDQQGNTGIG